LRKKEEETPMPNQTQPAPGSPSIADLIARAQRGEEEAFETLFHQYKQRVYALCLRMIGNMAEAEELTQEAFMQVFRKIHTFRGDSAFSTWLHRVSVNIVLMRLRKKTVLETPLQDVSRGNDDGDQRPEFGADDLALNGVIDRVRLERAVAQLPAGYKQVFVLHDVLGYEHNEIAAISGFSVGNSKSQLHKARTRLRSLLRQDLAEPEELPVGSVRQPDTSVDRPAVRREQLAIRLCLAGLAGTRGNLTIQGGMF
jgi:RNA polymerase sigma-70 factor (ECF subfamily)